MERLLKKANNELLLVVKKLIYIGYLIIEDAKFKTKFVRKTELYPFDLAEKAKAIQETPVGNRLPAYFKTKDHELPIAMRLLKAMPQTE